MPILLAAAVLLSLERLSYVWISRHPDRFRRVAAAVARSLAADPVSVVAALCWGFKAVQLGVFAWWCHQFGGADPWTPTDVPEIATLGVLLIVAGQTLNASVFYRIGRTGVFYGSRFGHAVTWTSEFPFSFLKHPQYVGAVTSIWGLFLILRFPQPDWYALPVLETVYYTLGAHLER